MLKALKDDFRYYFDSDTTAQPRDLCMWNGSDAKDYFPPYTIIVNFDYFRKEIAEVDFNRIVPTSNIFQILLIVFFLPNSKPVFFLILIP